MPINAEYKINYMNENEATREVGFSPDLSIQVTPEVTPGNA